MGETNDEDEYQVEEILAHKLFVRGQPKLHVKWVGYAKPTWEPLSAFLDTIALDKYEAKKGVQVTLDDRCLRTKQANEE